MKHDGWGKFRDADQKYFDYIAKLPPESKEYIYQFPLYVGQVNIGRHLFFYELYKKVLELNGHIADVGTYKGASFLFMAKLVRLFEPYNTTQVHGFDWFEGMGDGQYKCEYETLTDLISWQDLQDVAVLHKMDLTKELGGFFDDNPHLRFKYVFIDCGIRAVMDEALKYFWPRLVTGGILVMDHYNCEVSPEESNILEKYTNEPVMQMPFNRQPTGYVVKC